VEQVKNADLAMIQAAPVIPLSQNQATPISCDENPFWLDTGTTVHISPDSKDFYSLKKLNHALFAG
jgi:hypothetical protein